MSKKHYYNDGTEILIGDVVECIDFNKRTLSDHDFNYIRNAKSLIVKSISEYGGLIFHGPNESSGFNKQRFALIERYADNLRKEISDLFSMGYRN